MLLLADPLPASTLYSDTRERLRDGRSKSRLRRGECRKNIGAGGERLCRRALRLSAKRLRKCGHRFHIVAAPLCTNRKKHAVRHSMAFLCVGETVSESPFRSSDRGVHGSSRQPPPSSHGTPALSLTVRPLFPRFALSRLYSHLDARTHDGH